MERCADGQPTTALLHGCNGDIWMLLLKTYPAHWVRAHRAAQQAELLGISFLDRLGNDAADAAASGMAGNHAPDLNIVIRRQKAQQATEALHRTLASIQEAAIAAHHAPGAAVRKRRKPKRRLFRPKKAGPRAPLPETLGLTVPQGAPMAHTLVVALGARRVGVPEPGWLFGCSACAASVHGVARAVAFAHARCHHTPLCRSCPP